MLAPPEDTVDARRIPSLNELTVTFVPFALLLLAAVVAAIAGPSVPVARAQNLVRLSMLLAAPALAIYILRAGREPLSNLWRLYWTFALLAYLGHFHYAFLRVFHADPWLVMTQQTPWLAISNFVITLLWTIDVLLGWAIRRQSRARFWFRAFVHLDVLASFTVAAVIFRDGTVRMLGIGLLAVCAIALVLRWATRPAPVASAET
jgi:hypothetical protein